MRDSLALMSLTGLSAALALFVGEVALRFEDPARISSGWVSAFDMNFTKGHFTSENQLGYRGKKISISDGDFVALLVGDSQVECVACADGRLPEDALQQQLSALTGRSNVKVFTLGASGYGPDQELLALRSYFAKGYRADLVVVWQTLANDLWNAVFPSHSTEFGRGHLKPTFRLDENGGLIWPEGQIGDPFCAFYLQCVYRIQRHGSIDGFWEQYLPAPAEPTPHPPKQGLPLVHTNEAVDKEKSHWSIWLKPSSPRRDYGLALVRALYSGMEAETARRNARLLLLDVNRYTENGLAELREIPFFIPGDKYVAHKSRIYLAGGQDSYLATREVINRGFDAITVDIDRQNHTVSQTDPHLNENGNARVMEKLSMEIISRGWLR